MKKANGIILLQVLFLAGILMFSTGSDYNDAQQVFTAPSAVSHLAIRHDGYELANREAYDDLQAKLAVQSGIKQAADTLEQGRIPDNARALATDMEGANQLYLVPIAVDPDKKETILVAMSRYDQPAEVTAVIQKNDELSREIGIAFIGLPPAASIQAAINANKTSSAGKTVTIDGLQVVYDDSKETIDSVLASNPNLAREVNTLTGFNRYELSDAIAFLATSSKPSDEQSAIMAVLSDSEEAGVLVWAKVVDEQGVVRPLHDSVFLIRKPVDHEPASIYPAVISPDTKTSSAGRLSAVTDYLRLYTNDGPTWARDILRKNIDQIEQEPGISTVEPVGSLGKVFDRITQSLPTWFEAGMIAESQPIQVPGLERGFIVPVKEGRNIVYMLITESFTGIEYGQVSRVELNEYAQVVADSISERWPEDRSQQDAGESPIGAKRFMNYITNTAGLAKTSSAGLSDLLRFNKTDIELIDAYTESVLDIILRLEQGPLQDSTIEQLLQASEGLEQDIAGIERGIAASGINRQQQDELDAVKRTSQDLMDTIRSTSGIAHSVEEVMVIPSVLSARGVDTQQIHNMPDVLVEADGGMEQQFELAKRVSVLSEKHGRVVNELDMINERVGCNMTNVDINAMEVSDAGNTVAIATTEAGRQAFRTKGIENILMLQNVIEDGKYDLLSLAALAKGRYLKTRGIEDSSLNMLIRNAYRNLTGREIPADYLQNAAMIIEVILLPVQPVYRDGELEAYHMMRLLALIAA